jgi:L1 cell adhesion molecule like protein
LTLYEDIDIYTSLTRARFEELFRSTPEPVEKVLRDSKLDKSSDHEIVLVGGSIRISRIVKLPARNPTRESTLMRAVAYGAAIQAAILSGNTSEKTQDLLLLDVAPPSVGTETADRPHQAEYRCTNGKIFLTYSDNQFRRPHSSLRG